MDSKFGKHTEYCIDFNESNLGSRNHFGKPRKGRYEWHSCECQCHGIYLSFDERMERPVRKLDDESWKEENR